MKRVIALVLTMALSGAMLVGCQSTPAPAASQAASQAASSEAAKPVEITVVTSYGGDDGNRANYESAYKAYETATGNTVKDASGTSNEEWKSKIMADFETGAEPDVLFYFNGVDANKLVQGGKVVSIDEIRKTYPDYASNMRDDLLGASPADGKNYSVPVNGYWEGLFINKKVLKDCGVEVPGADYTWDQFLKDCETIKSKGITPIACSLQEVPHYWFEYCVFNHGTLATHTKLPASSTDEIGKVWTDGLNDIKTLYTKGYFPKNTTTATDAETFQLMADDKAAFAIDGSWKIGWFQENAKSIDDFTVTYVPGENGRKSTDIIGGLSMGYYITQKAWSDPAKQKACVDFVKAMTTDEVVSTFGATAVTALKNGTAAKSDTDSLEKAAMAMTKGATGIAPATQDGLIQTARTALFADIKNIATGKTTAEKAIDACLAIKS
ncbi:ABC transporter substrate-binding protein [Caproiciproducens faecalis]|uniref:Carbohydrate ABC transporter substrate-binding protein n=1 Tax=Caproiciproducens faecalis TaxID=2820301 RepID=A0ABS7DJ02_9FIRM|nr:ABC transporter substrate-binding protein [Caproiciproducens faecalis]MBW7571269.1 carbohydrate ABC transporter substrate-binding protein [Caproiciproducens faecalis]